MTPTVAAYNFCNPDFEAFLQAAATAGFDAVAIGFYKGYLDLPLETLSAEDEAGLRAKLDGYGLGLCAVFGGTNLLADDGPELLSRKLEAGARLGVATFDTGSISLADDPGQREADVATFVDRIRHAADQAARLGITICLETHGGYTGNADTCLEAMATIDHDHVRLAYDPANFLFYEGRRPEERLAELIPFIGHTHLKDHRGGKGNNDFPAIGEGETNYELLLPALLGGGYRGAYTLERAVGEDNEQKARAMARACAYVRGLLG